MKIAIVGAAGRMGRMLVKLAGEDKNLDVVAEIDVAEGYAREWPVGTEAVIDFSFHAAVPPSVEKAAAQGIPYVIGTTGLSADEQAVVDAAAKKIPVVQSGNYSLGVNLLLNLVQTAAQVLGPAYDVDGRKGMVGERPQGEIAIHALRGGSVVGDHTVMFAGDVERVEIAHKAQSREAFAAGALRAAQWAAGRAPGLYTMRDVLGFNQ